MNPTLQETVQTLYAAFGRGDIPTVLARLHPDAKWRLNAAASAPGAAAVPLFRLFTGPQQVGEFFALLGRELEFHAFEPVSFTSSDADVVARVRIETTVRRTGRRLRVESLHHFSFDAAARVVRFTEFTDTLSIAD